MSYQSTYQAAKAVSATVEKHFESHLAAARESGEEDLAPAPSAEVAEAIIDAAFWASLRREEGHSPKISIAFLPPEQAGKPLLFEKTIPLTPTILTKIAPGIEGPGIHLGVWHAHGKLYIWGTTTKIPNYCFVLDVSEPALLVIKHRRFHGFGKYTNVAVLKGDQIKIVDEYCAAVPDFPPILRSLLGASLPLTWNDSVNVLIQLAVSMRSHGRGGNILIVPSNSDNWRESIIKPIQYSIKPHFSGLANLVRQKENEVSEIFWQSALRREIDSIAGLTAVDGATIMTDEHDLIAFGAKIGLKEHGSRITQISFNEPIVGGGATIIHPAQSGGTRHLSAAQFIHDQHDCLSLVASQDGHFTVYSWSEHANMVQGHRIDSLLL